MDEVPKLQSINLCLIGIDLRTYVSVKIPNPGCLSTHSVRNVLYGFNSTTVKSVSNGRSIDLNGSWKFFLIATIHNRCFSTTCAGAFSVN